MGEFFAQLKGNLASEGDHYNVLIGLQSKWQRTQRGEKLGTVDLRDLSVSFSSLSEALLWWVDNVPESAFTRQITQVHIDPSYRYTCDRSPQNEAFLTGFWVPSADMVALCEGKIRFFYLHGDARQAHRELIERFGRQLLGQLYDFNLTTSNPADEPVIAYCKPQVSTNPMVARMMTITELLAKFQVPPQPVQRKTLKDLLASEKVCDKGPEATIHIVISLDDANWNKAITPELVRAFYQEFCACQLPAEAPQFFFYFGLEYEKENQQVQQEVIEAIENRQYGQALPQLEPVSPDDIYEWFTRVKAAFPPGEDLRPKVEALFPNQTTIDMADVINTLQKFIDQHNTGRMFGQP